jgi:hypothetical protein
MTLFFSILSTCHANIDSRSGALYPRRQRAGAVMTVINSFPQ